VAGDAEVACGPVACRQVEQHHLQAVGQQPVAQPLRGCLIGKLNLDARESGTRGTLEAVQQRHFSEQHREVGGKARHQVLRS
jgi:hypothetical protein